MTHKNTHIKITAKELLPRELDRGISFARIRQPKRME